ncbi:MAG: DUF6494 family protein [Gemmatimonadales bacterium]
MINDETLNLSVRKFLKQFGVEAQRTIEDAIRQADAAGKLEGQTAVSASVNLDLAGLDTTFELKDEIGFN